MSETEVINEQTGEIASVIQQPASETVGLPAVKDEKKSLVTTMASRWSVEPAKLLSTLKQTAFKQKDGEVSDAQMMALLIVCKEYGLNPFLKQIYAYPDKGGIVPVVGVDGWATVITRNPMFDGVEFRFSDDIITMPGAKPCSTWCDTIMHIKGNNQPTIVREYLDEVYRELSYVNPWKTHTKRMLRHKSYIQCGRIAFGLTGIFDEDEAQRIIESQIVQEPVKRKGSALNQKIAAISAGNNGETT